MTDAYIFDHVRSPRGRGKSDGSLHEVTPVELLSQVLGSLRDRNELDTSRVDDVIMMTSSTRLVSSSFLSLKDPKTWESNSTGVTSCKEPSDFPLPLGLLTWSKIYASVIAHLII